LPTYGIYAATKSAVETLTAILSNELRGRSVTVNAIAPGPTATDLFLHGKSQELINTMAKMNPLERLGTAARYRRCRFFPRWSRRLLGSMGRLLRANGGMV